MVGLHLQSDCGGKGSCGKCEMILQPAPEQTPEDEKNISSEDRARGVRLACQHKVRRDTRAEIVKQLGEAQILTTGVSRWEEWTPDSGHDGQFGVAIDLGTTTIVAYLLALASGVQINQIASLNPQAIFGEDVISRIAYATQEEGGLSELTKRITSEIDSVVSALVEASGIQVDSLSKMSIVGNTAMHHLLLGADVKSLGLAPYEPSIRDAVVTTGIELGLLCSKKIEVYLPPNIAGFVGGDTVGFILSQRLDLSEEVVLGIDVGTNGEIVLSNRGALSCCSAAAGPAFEGATIRYGMRGQEGAIEYVTIKDPEEPPEIAVIGDITPQGICGSAIVDTLAELNRSGIVDNTGRMQSTSRRVYPDDEFGLSYLLVEESATSRRISFNQKDIRQVQLAKAAIKAGITILLQDAGVTVNDLDSVMLAGAFGNYIRPESALQIGLLPPVDRNRIIQVGNAAGEGAKILLLSSEAREIANKFVSKTKYVELASHEDFQKIFIESTSLP
jgi:uncharacterized 2Fe-2S/4Fe-4S cluster protein (DUF4445 family)